MIRFSLFLAFFSMIFSLSAQQAESVFINKTILSWFDSEISTLETAIDQVSGEKVNFSAKKQLIKSIELINKNCLSIYNEMDKFLDEKTLASLKAKIFYETEPFTALDLKNRKFRAMNTFQEILMTQSDADSFLDNLALIKNIEDEFKQNESNFASNSRSGGVAKQLTEVLDLAQQNNQLLKSKYN